MTNTLPTRTPDEWNRFTDQGNGKLSTIARWDTRVVHMEQPSDVITHDDTYDPVEKARAEYGDWFCDERAAMPQPGDVIETYGIGQGGTNEKFTVNAADPSGETR
jgi:hypothetical protein